MVQAWTLVSNFLAPHSPLTASFLKENNLLIHHALERATFFFRSQILYEFTHKDTLWACSNLGAIKQICIYKCLS